MIKTTRKVQIPQSRFFRMLPMRAKILFSSKKSERCLLPHYAPFDGLSEDMIVGYEAGWPHVAKKLQ